MNINFEKKYLFSGYGFHKKEGPFLVLDMIFGDMKRYHFSIRNQKFTIRKTSKKYCIGGYDMTIDGFYPCPEKSEIFHPKYTLCDKCKRKQGFNPAFYNADYISLKQQKRNNKPHSVYLANFGYGVNKVGIAYAPRIRRRLLEQGARCAIIIKTCDNAYDAREIEEYTHKFLSVPEVVSRNKKIQLVINNYDSKLAKEKLNDMKNEISKEFDLDINNKIEVFDNYYLENNVLRDPDIVKNNYISGSGIAMIGSFLVVEASNSQFVIDLHPWISHIVQIDANIINNKYNKQIKQNSLF